MNNVSLPNATDKEGRYIHISQVTSGLKRNLMCPYCRDIVVAKKGKRIAHHFAHANETCFDVTNRDFNELDVPLYDRFNLYISASAWNELLKFHNTSGEFGQRRILTSHDPPLIREGFDYHRTYELTNEGKIPFGEATLAKFAEFQLNHVFERHTTLSDTVRLAYFGKAQSDGYELEPAKKQAEYNLIDLNIYRSQVFRLYQLDLYLLRIVTAEGVLFKIGVTTNFEARIREIERDLRPHFDVHEIVIDRLCKNRGAVERYAHHRFRDYLHPLGNFREYFRFDKKALANVRRDFSLLGDMELPEHGDWWVPDYHSDGGNLGYGYKVGDYRVDGLIGEILSGEKSWAQQLVERDHLAEAISEGTKKGMQKAKAKGIHVGRPSDDNADVLNKYPEIIEALNAGKGLRAIAREMGVSRNTVRKVRDAMP